MWGRVRRAGPALRSRGRQVAPEPSWVWPLRLSDVAPTGTAVTLRPLTLDDGPAFQAVRRANAAWLEPWDATSPDLEAPTRTYGELVEQYDADARAGRALPFAVEVEGRFVGQLNVGSIVLGSFRSCFAGYWVSRAVAGRMVVPTALALAGEKRDRGSDLHAVGALLDQDLGDGTLVDRFELHRRLVGFDLGQHVAGADAVALLDQPFGERALLHRRRERGHLDLDRHEASRP